MSERSPCVKCGQILHTGEGRITISLTVEDIEAMIRSIDGGGAYDGSFVAVGDLPNLRRRLVCAMGLLDADRAARYA